MLTGKLALWNKRFDPSLCWVEAGKENPELFPESFPIVFPNSCGWIIEIVASSDK
jgi:hypothetical protein